MLNARSYVAPANDLEESDDDLDAEERVAIDVLDANIGRFQLGQIMDALHGRKKELWRLFSPLLLGRQKHSRKTRISF